MKTFLHVGCGPQRKQGTTKGFNTDDWKELRLDIDESVQPDIVGTMTDMSRVSDASVDALFTQAQARGMRLITGKVLQDRHSPDGVRDDTVQGLIDSEALIQRWHGVDRLGYAITPRFAPTSTPEQLRGAGELAARYPGVWIQSHVAENLDEIR